MTGDTPPLVLLAAGGTKTYVEALAPFGRDADVLKMAARFVAERKA